ncbi:hypothetical protein AV654_17855 [Paenibacillus elgii]|uniref:Uncharacterized protein n=1 Tax=Paenibacillus elgii TaxID=189691 RepID=A0A161S453_9BACL|nr:hypothetical protein [Paenibacillus elgii]KZE79334.1 hypothetical protein AV654_17855 [Paenibacillus elgii]
MNAVTYTGYDGVFPMNQTATNEELLRNSVLLPNALSIIEEEARTLSASKDPIRRLYIAAAKVIHVRLTNEMAGVRKEMRQRGIQAEKIDISREEAKATIAEMIGRHMREVMDELQQKKNPR